MMPPPSSESVKALDVEAERSRRNRRPHVFNFFSFFGWSCQSSPGYKKSPPRLDTSLVGPLMEGGRGRLEGPGGGGALCLVGTQSEQRLCPNSGRKATGGNEGLRERLKERQ